MNRANSETRHGHRQRDPQIAQREILRIGTSEDRENKTSADPTPVKSNDRAQS
jgi:hypothetical protein